MARRLVVLGLLGSKLDWGEGPDRWERWRPTVSIVQREDVVVSRLDLIHEVKHGTLAEAVAQDVRQASPETEVRLHAIPWKNPWDFEEVYGSLLDLVEAYTFDPEHEDYLVHVTTGTHVGQICLYLLTESRRIPGKLLQTSPPARATKKSPGEFVVIDLDLSRYDRLARRVAAERVVGQSLLKSGIRTRNARFNRMIERVEEVALRTRAPILLMGPTGAGKSQLARRIFDLKKQRHRLSGPFVEVNCATLRGDAAMSTLFGHRKGAFTGAVSDRPGLLASAHHGVLFLDEIGELGLDEQAMLLRAVEERRFLPVGSDREVESEFQLLAGTNCDLRVAVGEGRFREDLLTRIHLWTFDLPGLTERPEDLEPNLDYELERFGDADGRRISMNREARALYLAFARSPEASWRGNFRDLNASVTRMATLAPGGRVDEPVVREELDRLRADWQPTATGGDDGLAGLLGADGAAALDRFERVQLAEVVRVCRGSASLSEAGRVLFAASRARRRSTNDADRLRKYLARFDLAWEALRGAPPP